MTAHMPFGECLKRLDAFCDGQLLHGSDPAHVFSAIAGGTLEGPYADALRMMLDWVPIHEIDQIIARNDLIHALGPLRLDCQAHDAPPEAYRALTRLIRAIDAAFDELAANARDSEYGMPSTHS